MPYLQVSINVAGECKVASFHFVAPIQNDSEAVVRLRVLVQVVAMSEKSPRERRIIVKPMRRAHRRQLNTSTAQGRVSAPETLRAAKVRQS